MADQESFVGRWSRRKSEAHAPASPSEPPAAAVTETSTSTTAAVAETAAMPAASEARAHDVTEPVDPAALPAIESLTYQSDFTVFLRPGVPAELRRRALRQLWRSDPVFANLDGLVEYGEDYSQIGMVETAVRTAYQVGRGMLDKIEAAAAQTSGEPAAADEVPAEPAAIEAEGDQDARAAAPGQDPLRPERER